MGRQSTTSAGSTTTDEPREPEIMRSAHLANILTLELVDMISRATIHYEEHQIGRLKAAELDAMRGMVNDVRAWHRLPAMNWRAGEPFLEPFGEPGHADNGAAPEPAEATS